MAATCTHRLSPAQLSVNVVTVHLHKHSTKRRQARAHMHTHTHTWRGRKPELQTIAQTRANASQTKTEGLGHAQQELVAVSTLGTAGNGHRLHASRQSSKTHTKENWGCWGSVVTLSTARCYATTYARNINVQKRYSSHAAKTHPATHKPCCNHKPQPLPPTAS